jgi:hypothetical protein
MTKHKVNLDQVILIIGYDENMTNNQVIRLNGVMIKPSRIILANGLKINNEGEIIEYQNFVQRIHHMHIIYLKINTNQNDQMLISLCEKICKYVSVVNLKDVKD